MPSKRKLEVPDNQLPLICMEPTEPTRAKAKPKRSSASERIARLEKRVTHVEADAALLAGQLEQEEEDY